MHRLLLRQDKSEKLFSDEFINKIQSLLSKCDIEADEKKSLRTQSRVAEITAYMRGICMEGKVLSSEKYNYIELFSLINAIQMEFSSYQRTILDEVKKEIESSVEKKYPFLVQEYKRKNEIRATQIAGAKRIQCAICVGVGCCGLWALIQQPLTLCNLGRKMRIDLHDGQVDCCDAVSSVNSLCEEYKEQQNIIKECHLGGPAIQRMY